MNPTIPAASFHLGRGATTGASTTSATMAHHQSARDTDTQNYRLALLQAILEKEQRTDDMSGGVPSAAATAAAARHHHLSSLASAQHQQARPSLGTSQGLQALMNSEGLASSLLGGTAAAARPLRPG